MEWEGVNQRDLRWGNENVKEMIKSGRRRVGVGMFENSGLTGMMGVGGNEMGMGRKWDGNKLEKEEWKTEGKKREDVMSEIWGEKLWMQGRRELEMIGNWGKRKRCLRKE